MHDIESKIILLHIFQSPSIYDPRAVLDISDNIFLFNKSRKYLGMINRLRCKSHKFYVCIDQESRLHITVDATVIPGL